MAALPPRRVLAVVVAAAGLAAVVAGQDLPNRHAIEQDLTHRSVLALRAATVSNVDVSFTGRDGTLTAGSRDEGERAAAIVRALDGVRVANLRVVTRIAAPSPGRPPGPRNSLSPGGSLSPGPSLSPSVSPTPGPSPTPGAGTPPPPVQQQLVSLPPVTFLLGSAQLDAAGLAVVRQVAGILQANPAIRVSIEGHTDTNGTPEANLILSQQRAETVRATLESLGVAPDRMTATGFGQTRLKVPDDSPTNQAINRRVEFVVRP
jgi:outer membrane protein OmpA-like peptidoglycan-associated protein